MTHNILAIKRFLSLGVLALCSITIMGTRVNAVEYAYKIRVSPLVQRYVVKPTFNSIETEFTISNEGDPAYIHITIPTKSEIVTTVSQVLPFVEKSIYGRGLSFLMVSEETRRFRVNIKRNQQELDLRDHVVDIIIDVQPPLFSTDYRLSANIQPSIHSKIVLSASADGKIPMDPKIALFRNKDGYFILDSEPANLILTLQNRGNYMFPVSGSITIIDPTGKRMEVPILKTHVSANNQKNLVTDAKKDDNILLTIDPNDLRGGQYSVSSTLKMSNDSAQNVYGHTTFFVVPKGYIMVIVWALLATLGIIFYIGSRHI